MEHLQLPEEQNDKEEIQLVGDLWYLCLAAEKTANRLDAEQGGNGVADAEGQFQAWKRLTHGEVPGIERGHRMGKIYAARIEEIGLDARTYEISLCRDHGVLLSPQRLAGEAGFT